MPVYQGLHKFGNRARRKTRRNFHSQHRNYKNAMIVSTSSEANVLAQFDMRQFVRCCCCCCYPNSQYTELVCHGHSGNTTIQKQLIFIFNKYIRFPIQFVRLLIVFHVWSLFLLCASVDIPVIPSGD